MKLPDALPHEPVVQPLSLLVSKQNPECTDGDAQDAAERCEKSENQRAGAFTDPERDFDCSKRDGHATQHDRELSERSAPLLGVVGNDVVLAEGIDELLMIKNVLERRIEVTNLVAIVLVRQQIAVEYVTAVSCCHFSPRNAWDE